MTYTINRAAHVMLLAVQGSIYVAAGIMHDLPNVLGQIQANLPGIVAVIHIIYTEWLNAKNHYAQGQAASLGQAAGTALTLATSARAQVQATLAQLDTIITQIKVAS